MPFKEMQMQRLIPLARRTGALPSLLLLAGLVACADPTGTAAPAAPHDATALDPSASRSRAGARMPASVEWNAVARDLVATNRSSVFVAFRTYALLSVAQLEALLDAERRPHRGPRPSARAAIAAASAVVLSHVYPADAAALEARLRQQLASSGWLEREPVDAAAGEAVGRAAGAAVVEHARTDRYLDPWTGTVPTGPGVWYSSTTPPTPPAGAAIATARTWFLSSPDQFRPPPPPAFGSPAFAAALAEVRHLSDHRTPEQEASARFWAFGAGTYTPPGYWNAEAATLAVRDRLSERRAARLLALLNTVAVDAIIASNDAKVAYWLIRPSQADPAITLPLPLPNFASYPSNHATISAAMAEVIAAAFPREARRLRAAADEAAMSRVYGGIHYRFDGDAGLVLGRRVAAWGLARGANVVARYP
jgi:membrane-associated phospholipid phosphatase